MKSETIKFQLPGDRVDALVDQLHETIKEDTGTDYPATVIRSSVVTWLHSRLDVLFEDAVERLTSPSYEDAREFARMLDAAATTATAVPASASLAAVASVGNTAVFSGRRTFSLDRMAAMISYFAERTGDLYKTKLNKLLFYADFTNYYLHGHSISGTRYVHLPYGPVPDGYEETLETLGHYGVIDIVRQHSTDLVKSGSPPPGGLLSGEEKSTLEWVAREYGSMSASGLTELSHQEKAWSNTRTGENIAYEYAKFLAKLPQKTA